MEKDLCGGFHEQEPPLEKMIAATVENDMENIIDYIGERFSNLEKKIDAIFNFLSMKNE